MSHKSGPAKTYLFGSFSVQHDRERQTKRLRVDGPRLAVVAVFAAALTYACIVSAGYAWLHHVRKLEQITIADVALLRWKQVRRNLGAQQFKNAMAEWQAGRLQSAYLIFSAALKNDPDNVEGRSQSADFLSRAGATSLAVNILKDGLQRQPGNLRLLERTFDLLTTVSRDKEALALLRGPLAQELTGPNRATLRTYELLATLNAEGTPAAEALLRKYPEILQDAASGLVVARVRWETQERFAAIEAVKAYLRERPTQFSGYALLAQYQEAAGMSADARETARLACENIPREIAPRILRIGTFAPSTPADFLAWRDEIKTYLSDFGDKPEAIEHLSDLAGRKGWVDLCRTLYEANLTQELEGRVLALHYVDALLRNARAKEAGEILADLEPQVQETSPLTPLLRQRQVETAAALGDREVTRERAKRLANALRQDPDKLESYRRRFQQLGLIDAVAEMESVLSSVPLAAKK